MRRFAIDELPAVLDVHTTLVPSLQEFESEDRLFRKVFDWGSTRLEVRLKVDAGSANFGPFLAWLQAKGRTEKFSLPLGQVPGFMGCDEAVPQGSNFPVENLFRARRLVHTLKGSGDRTLLLQRGGGAGDSVTEDEAATLTGCLLQAGGTSAAYAASGGLADLGDSVPGGKTHLITDAKLAEGSTRSVEATIDPPLYSEPPVSGNSDGSIQYYLFWVGVAVEPVFRLSDDIEVRADPDNPAEQLATIRLIEDVEQPRPAQAWITPATAPYVGQVLHANLFLPDGEATGVSYQWKRTPSGGSAADITGETDSELAVPNAIGSTLHCAIAYTDPDGNAQTIDTPETLAIVAAPASSIQPPGGVAVARTTLRDDLPDGGRGTREEFSVSFNAATNADAYTAEFENLSNGQTVFRSVAASPVVFNGRFEFEGGLSDRVRVRVRSVNAAGTASAWSTWVERNPA